MILELSQLFCCACPHFSACGSLRKLRLTDTIKSMIGAPFPKAPARHSVKSNMVYASAKT